MEVKDNKLQWDLKEYYKLDKTPGASVESPVYRQVRGDTRVDWQLVLYPGGVGTATIEGTFDQNYNSSCTYYNPASLYLQMVRCNYTAVDVKFKVNIHPDRTLAQDCSEDARFYTMKKCRRWGWRAVHGCGSCRHPPAPKTLNRAVIDGDVITITCEIYQIEANGERLDIMPVRNDVIDHMRSFYEQGRFTDFEVVVGTKAFHVHKAVLAARSPVIAAMFDHNTKENALNRLEITDFSEEAVEEFIKFLYASDSPDFGVEAGDLLTMAEKYDVKHLKTESEVALARALDVQNATVVLRIADLHRAHHLKKFTLQFIKENIKAVMEDAAKWESLPRCLVDEFIKSVFPEVFKD